MNVNFGLFPPLNETVTFDQRRPKIRPRLGQEPGAKERAISARALADLERWIVGETAGRGGIA